MVQGKSGVKFVLLWKFIHGKSQKRKFTMSTPEKKLPLTAEQIAANDHAAQLQAAADKRHQESEKRKELAANEKAETAREHAEDEAAQAHKHSIIAPTYPKGDHTEHPAN